LTKSQDSIQRLVFLLSTVEREGRHLKWTASRLFVEVIDSDWVKGLEQLPEIAERVDAFGARFGRMQDTIGDRLIPELRRQILESPGAALDNLNRMEKLGLLRSVDDWVEARQLRNALVHEYMRDPAAFAGALSRAGELVPLLLDTYDRIRDYVEPRFVAPDGEWPPPLACGDGEAH
jgi:hypothetical protein